MLNKNPINRNNLFFDKKSFDYELEMAMDYMQQDCNQTIILYQVDNNITNTDMYLETQKDEIRFKTPVVVPCMYKIYDSTNETYNQKNVTGRYIKGGIVEINVFEKTLIEMNCDINYGDYIGIQISETQITYYTISDDDKKNYANNKTMYGFKKFWRKCKAVPVDINEFNG